MRAPSQASLDALFGRVTRARVSPIRKRGETIAALTGERARALRELVAIRDFDGNGFHCMCAGDVAIELFEGDAPLATLGMHHGLSMRCDAWDSDAMLVDGRAFLAWLAREGAPSYLETFEEDVRRRERDRVAREAWIAGAPSCLLPLDRFESRLAEAEAQVRAAYASPVIAAAALLAWYGSSRGPYSGFPSYETLPQQLLFRLGIDVAREAATRDEASLRGAARFFSDWEMVRAKKSALADVDDALWARMQPLVPPVSDNAQRFASAARIGREARARRANPAPTRTASGAMLVGVGEERLHGLASDGTNLYAGDGQRLVVFAPGNTSPRTLATLEDPFFELAYLGQMVILTQANVGVVAKVLLDGTRVPMATGRARPMSLALAPAVLAWLEQENQVDTAVVRFENGAPAIVRRPPRAAWGLVADRRGLFWLERADADVVLLGEHGVMARFESPSAPLLLAASPDELLVASGRTLHKTPKTEGGALATLATLGPEGGTIEAVAADDFDVFALTTDADRMRGRLEHVKLGGGRTTILAEYERPPWDRGSMVLDARAVSWTTNDRVLSMPRS